MTAAIETKPFAAGLAQAAKVIERRTEIPTLHCAKLSWADGVVTIETTDLDIWLRQRVPAEVDGTGAACVNAKTLLAIAKKAPGAQIMLSLAEGGESLSITSERARFTLPCQPVEDFPQPAAFNAVAAVDFAPGELAGMIGAVSHAISKEETRYYLNGVYLHAAEVGAEARVLRAVATDGHQLALAEAGALPAEADWGAILPAKTGALMAKIQAAAALQIGDSGLRLRAGDLELISKQIDGVFPDYSRAIPQFIGQAPECTLKARAADLSDALARVSAVSDERTIAAALTVGEGGVEVSARGEDSAATEQVAGEARGAIRMGFNVKYLLNALAKIPGDAVLRMASSAAPLRIEAAYSAGPSFVIMPMRV